VTVAQVATGILEEYTRRPVVEEVEEEIARMGKMES
jgi:hypothetical protein